MTLRASIYYLLDTGDSRANKARSQAWNIQSSGEDWHGKCSVIMCNHKGKWVQDTGEEQWKELTSGA